MPRSQKRTVGQVYKNYLLTIVLFIWLVAWNIELHSKLVLYLHSDFSFIFESFLKSEKRTWSCSLFPTLECVGRCWCVVGVPHGNSFNDGWYNYPVCGLHQCWLMMVIGPWLVRMAYHPGKQLWSISGIPTIQAWVCRVWDHIDVLLPGCRWGQLPFMASCHLSTLPNMSKKQNLHDKADHKEGSYSYYSHVHLVLYVVIQSGLVWVCKLWLYALDN